LARALYKRDSKIMLIDGALSALDARVARHIMEEGIRELCRDKIVVLVTYDLDQAREMEYVMLMEEGTLKKFQRSSEFFGNLVDEQEMERLRAQIKKTAPQKLSEKSEQTQILKDEGKNIGKIKWSLYKEFFSYSGTNGIIAILTMFLLHGLINMNAMAVSLFLAFTLSQKFTRESSADESEVLLVDSSLYSMVLLVIMASAILTSFLGKCISNKIFMRIALNIHNKMTSAVLHTRVKFFEENTHGRILNRFTKDIAAIDNMVFIFLEMIDYNIRCLFTIIIIFVSCPWIVLVAAVTMIYALRIRRYNLKVTRDTYRLKATLMSPINSLIQDTINGLTTIRSFCRQEHFLQQMFDLSDVATGAFVTSSAVNRWTALRLDFMAYIITSFFAFYSLFIHTNYQTVQQLALLAIGFQLSVEVARNFNTAIRWSVNVENDMTYAQRLMEYASLKHENYYHKKRVQSQSVHVHDLKGEIEFRGVQMRYAKSLQPALNDLSFSIEAGEKIAIVGRTGSGKSSLFQLLQLFRYPSEGEIVIDGVNLRNLDASSYRSCLSVVLQQPVLLQAESLRTNLDPGDLYSDEEIKHALARAGLAEINNINSN